MNMFLAWYPSNSAHGFGKMVPLFIERSLGEADERLEALRKDPPEDMKKIYGATHIVRITVHS